MKYLFAVSIFLSQIALSQFALGAVEIPRAYRIIADQYSIPAVVFFSIAMQESGKTKQGKYLPWPWTLNIDEQPYYYATREAAEVALLQALDAARANGKIGKVAVGLGQIYMPAHIHNFQSPLQALDPTHNLHYAAQLLATHYLSTVRAGNPDWWIAVGKYHSPHREAPAKAYRSMVYRRCLKISNRCNAFGNPEHTGQPQLLGAR
jgi:hypothetical protein